MRVVSKTEYRKLSGVELAMVDEVLQITINKTVIGYWVPPAIWLDLKRDAEKGQDPPK